MNKMKHVGHVGPYNLCKLYGMVKLNKICNIHITLWLVCITIVAMGMLLTS